MKNGFTKLKATASVVSICIALAASGVSAQTLAALGTMNRAKAIGEMTDARVMEVLREEGRAAMSGAFFETDSDKLDAVRRQGFWDRWPPDVREDLAHLVGLIMRRICGEASAAFRWSFV